MYTRIIQYADITEVYKYTKSPSIKPRKRLSSIQRKRKKDVQTNKKRTRYSSFRARQQFFRLVYNNLYSCNNSAFITFTFAFDLDYNHATRLLSRFFIRLNKYVSSFQDIKTSYIGVPERTKNGRYQFNYIFFNLPSKILTTERDTRNLQRLFSAGYIDICPTYDKSEKIAGYMAKYLSKTFENDNNRKGRAYNCSRNIIKTTSYSTSQDFAYYDLILPDHGLIKQSTYDTLHLGQCIKEIYKNNQ